jgi:hypothetical protein
MPCSHVRLALPFLYSRTTSTRARFLYLALTFSSCQSQTVLSRVCPRGTALMIDLVYLPGLFSDFCNHFNGKISWGMTATERTNLILGYFAERAKSEHAEPIPGYMLIDQVWRSSMGS